ncbi:hypothetical protein [Robertmurraya sp. FSL R5-0851]|uniref:hypothetical protein n=1 Tax=Robertmurraya sp. FSL R5-0851 TaxID=2921584 RepID=UPI0030FBEBB6
MEPYVKREKNPYKENNLIRIEAKTGEKICSEYLQYIENGFRLTVEDIATYLGCTYQHVINKVVPEVEHIRITELSKMILMKYAIDYGIDNSISQLFTKRILFSEKGFKEHINNTIEHVLSYKRFSVSDFEPEFIYEVNKRIEKVNEKKRGRKLTLQSYMTKILDAEKWNGFENKPEYYPINSYPIKLYTQEELMREHGLVYKVDFYRNVELSLGYRKLKYGNLIRYEKIQETNDFVFQTYICIFNMLREKHGEHVMKVIQEKAITGFYD